MKPGLLDHISHLSEQRQEHSRLVADVAMDLCTHYGHDDLKEKAYTAGILHDIAKEYSKEALLNYAQTFGHTVRKIEYDNPVLLHAAVGAHICQQELGIQDEEVFLAISYHTTGRARMKLLEKIIFLADIIEPLRTFDDVETVRKLAYSDLDSAVHYASKQNVIQLMHKNKLICNRTLECYNYYCKNTT
jgi:predicted HD superfamily hydrolase involved in NAD metabolism